ncbi:unnamed protein product [Diamesa serratosioi]
MLKFTEISLIVIGLIILNLRNIIALDLSQDIAGIDCTVKEPIYNHIFNFTKLKSTTEHFVNDETQNEMFTFNVCGVSTRKCNNETAAACLRQPHGKEIILGYTDQLLWNNGRIHFAYTGEKCAGNPAINYTLNVLLQCDYREVQKDFITVFPRGHDKDKQCEFTAVYRTSSSCMDLPENVKSAKCLVTDNNGHTLNLNPLGNTNNEIEKAGSDEIFIISICKPVLYGHDSMCPAGSSICFKNSSETDITKQYRNYGSMTSDPIFKDNKIIITMTSTEFCTKSETFSSIIEFMCKKNADHTVPKFERTVGCTHFFIWETVYACVDVTSCIAGEFDFRSLSGISYNIKMNASNPNNTDEYISFGICSSPGDPCMENSGSCIVKKSNGQSTQAGELNKKLELNHAGRPFILYENGALCKDINTKQSTLIDFICADNVLDEGVVLIEDKTDTCQYVIHFKTLLACQGISSCKGNTMDGNGEVDLTRLIDFDSNYIARINETTLPKEKTPIEYHLNICRPLNSKYSLNCHGGSGACRTIKEDGKFEHELSLGYPGYIVSVHSVLGEPKAEIRYFKGSQCPDDKDLNITTSIKFFCDEKAGLGSPILQSIDDCLYSFDFPTNVICNDQKINVKPDTCLLFNEKLNTSIDLRQIGDQGSFEVLKPKNEKFSVNLCGEKRMYNINYKQSKIEVKFEVAQRCDSDGKIDVVVELTCGSGLNISSTKTCSLLLMQETPLVCPLFNIVPKAALVPNGGGNDALDESKNALSFGYIFLLLVVILTFVALFYVLRNPERRDILRNIFRRRNTSRVQYSRVRSNEESMLLHNTDGAMSDSDDDIIL